MMGQVIYILLLVVGIGLSIALSAMTIAVIVWAFQINIVYGIVGAVLFETLPFVILIAWIAHLARLI